MAPCLHGAYAGRLSHSATIDPGSRVGRLRCARHRRLGGRNGLRERCWLRLRSEGGLGPGRGLRARHGLQFRLRRAGLGRRPLADPTAGVMSGASDSPPQALQLRLRLRRHEVSDTHDHPKQHHEQRKKPAAPTLQAAGRDVLDDVLLWARRWDRSPCVARHGDPKPGRRAAVAGLEHLAGLRSAEHIRGG